MYKKIYKGSRSTKEYITTFLNKESGILGKQGEEGRFKGKVGFFPQIPVFISKAFALEVHLSACLNRAYT